MSDKEYASKKEEFVRKLAHDIKGPIGNTIMFSELVFDNLEVLSNTKPELASELENIMYLSKNIHRVNKKLINQLQSWVDTYELEYDKLEMFPSPVDIAKLVDEILDLNDLYLDKKNINLQKQIPGNLTVEIDKDVLSRILDTLLTQSITYIENDSTIQLKVEELDEAVRIAVADNYQGSRDNLIQRFTEPTDDIEDLLPSEGILKATSYGMIFINKVLEELGGESGVDVTDNQTEFWFTIPA